MISDRYCAWYTIEKVWADKTQFEINCLNIDSRIYSGSLTLHRKVL